jgi:hypothetical protein
MYSWQPGAVACTYNYLAANNVFGYKAANPTVPVIVRFPHPPLWHQNPAESARQLGQFVASKWPELRTLNPYVYFAHQLNLHYESGNPNPAEQAKFTTPAFYQLYANWVRTTADVIKNAAPDMQLVTPPFAFGFNEDGSPNSDGVPTLGWAGYDFLADTIRVYFNNILTFHAYWGYPTGGSVPDWLYEPELSSWYAFRWQRLLKLFEARYHLQARLIIDEAASFGPADPDFTTQLLYFARQCLDDPRVIALTYYLWADTTGDVRSQRNAWTRIPNLAHHLEQLKSFSAAIPKPVDLSTYTDDATDLSGLVDLLPPEAVAPWPESAPAATERPLRVLLEDGRVRTMPIEEYLRYVVPNEMPALWPSEALKAQAVASRSYARYAIEHPRHHPVADICTTTHCQHFDANRTHERADEAITATRGLVLWHQGKIANGIFSARCGGHTRNNEDVWRGTPLAYLRGVPCPDTGEKQGHGIGFCQYGGRTFAEQGRTFDQILGHYYQEISLGQAPKLE